MNIEDIVNDFAFEKLKEKYPGINMSIFIRPISITDQLDEEEGLRSRHIAGQTYDQIIIDEVI